MTAQHLLKTDGSRQMMAIALAWGWHAKLPVSLCQALYPSPRQSLHRKVLLKDRTSGLAQLHTEQGDRAPGASVFPPVFSPNNKLALYQSPLRESAIGKLLT